MGIKQEHEIIKTKFEIQEQALQNIIQEIHDNIGQVLSLAKLHLGTLDFSKPDEVAQKTLTSNHLIGKAIKDLRNLARHLDATYIGKIGLYKAVAHETGYIPSDRAMEPVVSLSGRIGDLTEEEELMLFRIIQEAIQYFLKNNDTSRLSVHLDSLPHSLTIQVQESQTEEDSTDASSMKSALNAWLKDINDRSVLIGAQTTYHEEGDQQHSFITRFNYNKTKP